MTTDTRWIIGVVLTAALALGGFVRQDVQALRQDVRADLTAVALRIDTLVYEVAAVKAQHP